MKEIKDSINWDEREKELRDICDKYRKYDGSYDCLVPGSGGKDSFMQAHLLKYKYNESFDMYLGPPYLYRLGVKNHQAWIHAGFG